MSPHRSHTPVLSSPHGLPLLPQACKRCYSRKRKPRCSLCEEVDVECVVELRSTEKRLLEQLNSSKARIVDLEQRLNRLDTARIDGDVHHGGDFSRAQDEANGDSTIGSSPVLGLSSLAITGLLLGPAHSPTDTAHGSPLHTALLPTKSEALQMLRTYMSGFKQSHHVLELSELEADAERVYEGDGMTSPEAAASRFRCLGTVAAYLKDVRDVGKDEQYNFCREICVKSLPLVLEKEDIVAVQAFGMLAWFAIAEPGGPNLFQVVGLATRTAISLRLHRRDDVYFALLPPFKDPIAKHRHNEKRKDIFWGVYCLDRLTMHVLGLPPGIRDQDIDVDLPTTPTTSPGDNSVPSTALRIHNIKQRRLYGAIQDKFYAVNARTISRDEAEVAVAPFVKEIRDWYDSSPLKTAFVPISPATISKQCLDDLCYHQMVLALHRPSPLVADIPASFVTVLLQSSGTSVDLYWHYWKNKQILINWIHLYQIFISCSTLIYCFCECQTRPELVPVSQEIVELRIGQCTELLTSFAPLWPHSPEFRRMFDTLVASFEAQRTAMECPADVATGDAMTMNIAALLDLMLPLEGMDTASQSRLGGFTPNEVMRGIWDPTR